VRDQHSSIIVTERTQQFDPRPSVANSTLDQFASAAQEAEGLALSSLAVIDQVEVRTRNSLYRMTWLGGGRVMVCGGSFFPEWSEAVLAGSTLGGSCLKTAWLGCGFCMEFLHEGRRIVTTRVREIRAVPPPPSRPS
jgi:hypothetical protein